MWATKDLKQSIEIEARKLTPNRIKIILNELDHIEQNIISGRFKKEGGFPSAPIAERNFQARNTRLWHSARMLGAFATHSSTDRNAPGGFGRSSMSNRDAANKAWWIPVRSDRGEEYPNAKAAAKAFGRNHGAVLYAIHNNQKCAGRYWERCSD